MMFLRKFFLFTLFLSQFHCTLFAQEEPVPFTKNMKAHLDKLCSRKMYGRGYQFGGVEYAQKYIVETLESHGLRAKTHTFLLTANVFPKKGKLKIEGKRLQPGVEYIPFASSPSWNETVSLSLVDISKGWKVMLEDSRASGENKVLAIDASQIDSLPREQRDEWRGVIRQIQKEGFPFIEGLVLFGEKKLTFSASTSVGVTPAISILGSALHIVDGDEMNICLHAELLPPFDAANVYATIPGRSSDSSYVLTAHYDHLGAISKSVIFPGANDNGSGTAFLLEVAKHLSENTPKYDVHILFFSGEEIGLVGSHAFVRDNILPLGNVKFLFNFDIFGTGEEGVQIVNSRLHTKAFDLLKNINNGRIHQLKSRGPACNSDHCAFESLGVKTFFLYTLGGSKAYHDVYDVPEHCTFIAAEPMKDILYEFMEEF